MASILRPVMRYSLRRLILRMLHSLKLVALCLVLLQWVRTRSQVQVILPRHRTWRQSLTLTQSQRQAFTTMIRFVWKKKALSPRRITTAQAVLGQHLLTLEPKRLWLLTALQWSSLIVFLYTNKPMLRRTVSTLSPILVPPAPTGFLRGLPTLIATDR